MQKSALLIDPTATMPRALETVLGFEVGKIDTDSFGRANRYRDLARFDLVVGAPAIWAEDEDRSREDHFYEAVDVMQPELFLLETVRGLDAPRHRGFLEDLLDDLGALGYEVEHKVIELGGRKSLVIIGRRDGHGVIWDRHAYDPAAALANLIRSNLA